MMGRKTRRSANSAAIVAKALRATNIRNKGKLEKIVAASPQAKTTDVRIRAGPIRTVARSMPTAGLASGLHSNLRLLRK
jgi:hypothetical protein